MKSKALVLVAWLSEVMVASQCNFYFCPSGEKGIAVTNRVGERASVGWVVQPIANVNDVTYPPTTNGPYYIDAANGEQYYDGVSMNQTNIMGYENCSGLGYVGDGEGSWSTFKLGDGYGYIRFFSDSTVTGAAYYGDSSRKMLKDIPEDIADDVVVISNVNPAYVIPGFGVSYPTNWHLQSSAMGAAYGEVGTSPAGGANQLADYMVSVRWENVTLGTSGYVAVSYGTWVVNPLPLAIAFPDAVTNTLRFIAVGISARPGLPVSQEEIRYVITVPESVSITSLLTAALMVVRARRARHHA